MKKSKKKATPKTDLLRRNEDKILNLYKQGARNIDIANTFKVSNGLVIQYLNNNPEFKEKVWEMKSTFDVDVVEKALLERATGKEYEEVTTEISNVSGKEKKLIKKIKKFIPPDTAAIIFHLINRGRGKWSNRQEVNHSFNADEAKKKIETLFPPIQ